MSLNAYIPLAAAILNALLTIFVLRVGVQAKLRIAYLIWGVSIVVWNTGTYQMFRVESHAAALDWARFLQMGVIFLPISLFHLMLHICKVANEGLVLSTYAIGFILGTTILTGGFIADVRDAGYAWYTVGGPAFWGFVVLEATLGLSTLVFLWRVQRNAPRMERRQYRSLLWAMGILVAGGNNDILPIIGIYYYPFIEIPIFPLGSLCAIFYGILVAYSVLQHRLLDVHVGLSQLAAHVMRLAFLFLIGFMLMLVVALLAPAESISHFAFWSALGVLVAAGFISSRYMPKLLGAGNDSLEHRLLGDHFEYQDKIRVFIEQCRWHAELNGLLNDLHSLFVNTLNLREYSVILRDESNRAFARVRSHPANASEQIPELSTDAPVFRYFARPENDYLALRTVYAENRSALQTSARDQLKEIPGVLAFPLLVDQHPLGFVIVGEKANERIFTRTDIQLLTELATSLALVINQISLKSQLLHAREMELLGRMSRGMAHDLNNLTTPVSTLLQLLAEGESEAVLRADLVPVATRNILTMREYISEALFFSENLRPDLRNGRLDVLVQEIVDWARQSNRKGKEIEYSLRLCGDVMVEMDHVLIRRLLSNVIANAVDASEQRGRVEVELIRLVKTDPDCDWYRVRVIDHGTGIPQENLDRIFQPYFSTKKTGDENRGFGLGLAICRKIAALHGGSLVVSSEVGKGTIVNLDLPNCHDKQKLPQSPESIAGNF